MDIQLKSSNLIDIERIERFIYEVSSRIGALLVMTPFVVHFPYNHNQVVKYLELQERERREGGLLAKRMKEILVSRQSSVSGFSGIGLYENSNCSVHIWPDTNFLSFDISYLYDFHENDVKECMKNFFDIDTLSGLYITRKNGIQMIRTIKE